MRACKPMAERTKPASSASDDIEQIVAAVVRQVLAEQGKAAAASAPAPQPSAHQSNSPKSSSPKSSSPPVAAPAKRPRRNDDDLPRRGPQGSTLWRERLTTPQTDDLARATEPFAVRPPGSLRPGTAGLPGLRRLAHHAGLEPITSSTPARLGIGRAGLRYPTATYLTLRGDHAVAKDAVVSEPSPALLAALGAVELRTKAADLESFLLQPELGRSLDEASLLRLRSEGTRGADIQVIFADGLSAWAAERNQGLLPALQRGLSAAGFSHGKPLWVHRARIAVADQIGVELGAKATLICLGERPGLGTGDSLSIYIAWNPKIGQDNAEKNCISNVRPAGFSVEAAATQAVDLLQRAREIGAGGLAIGRGPAVPS